jgi:hypothetical protein
VPEGVEAVVESVRVVLPEAAAVRVMLVTFSEGAGPFRMEGVIEVVTAKEPTKLLRLLTVIWELAEDPAGMVSLARLAAMEKSGVEEMRGCCAPKVVGSITGLLD